MFNVALKGLRAHKLRMALTGFAIVLGVSFVSGTYVFTDSINATFSGLFKDVYAGIDVSVRAAENEFEADFGPPSSGSDIGFDESVLAQIRAIDGVQRAEPEVGSDAQLIDKNGDPIGGQGPPTLGFSWTTSPELNPTVIREGNGRAPEAPGEVVIDANTAKLNDFILGDTILIQSLAGPAEEFEIVGINNFGEADTLAGATLASFEFKEAQRFFGLEGLLTYINIQAEDGVSPEELQSRIQQVVSDDFDVVTGSQQTQENQSDINEGLGFINVALLSFAGVAIFVCTFIIQNTFRITIAQRSKELALLRAVGATRLQVMRMVLLEAFAIAVVASFVGLIAGIGISYLIRGLANAGGLGLPEGELTVLPRTVVVAMLVGVVVTMVSALMPAVKASRVTPIEALRDNEASSKRRSLLVRGLLSSLGMAAGGAVLALGLFGDIANPIVPVGFGVFILFIAVASFAPILSRPLANVLGFPFTKLRGMAGRIALENTKRTPRRTASTAAALMIGVSLVAFVSIFASSVKQTIDEVVTKSIGADVIVFSSDFVSGVSTQVADDLEQLDEVGAVARTFYSQGILDGETSKLIAGVEAETFGEMFFLDPTIDSYEELGENDLIVRSTLLEELGLSVGDTIELQLSEEFQQEVTIIGSFGNDFDTEIVASFALIDRAIPDRRTDVGVYLNYADNVSFEDGRAAVDELMQGYPTASVQSQSEIVSDAKTQIDGLLALFWGLLGLAIVIAVLGITNTLALSITERTREIGLLRAVGMTKRQVRTMVRAEAVIISLFGATLGILMGIFFAWAILQALESEGLTGFLIPVGQITAYFILAAIAGVIASIWPAYRASKVDVLDAINFD